MGIKSEMGPALAGFAVVVAGCALLFSISAVSCGEVSYHAIYGPTYFTLCTDPWERRLLLTAVATGAAVLGLICVTLLFRMAPRAAVSLGLVYVAFSLVAAGIWLHRNWVAGRPAREAIAACGHYNSANVYRRPTSYEEGEYQKSKLEQAARRAARAAELDGNFQEFHRGLVGLAASAPRAPFNGHLRAVSIVCEPV